MEFEHPVSVPPQRLTSQWARMNFTSVFPSHPTAWDAGPSRIGEMRLAASLSRAVGRAVDAHVKASCSRMLVMSRVGGRRAGCGTDIQRRPVAHWPRFSRTSKVLIVVCEGMPKNCNKCRPDSMCRASVPLVQAVWVLPHQPGRSRLHAVEELAQQLANFRGLLPG